METAALSALGVLLKALLGLAPLILAEISARKSVQLSQSRQIAEVQRAQLHIAMDRPRGIDAAVDSL